MTEKEYMDVGDLARIRCVRYIIKETDLFDDPEKTMRLNILRETRKIEEILENRVNESMEKVF